MFLFQVFVIVVNPEIKISITFTWKIMSLMKVLVEKRKKKDIGDPKTLRPDLSAPYLSVCKSSPM